MVKFLSYAIFLHIKYSAYSVKKLLKMIKIFLSNERFYFKKKIAYSFL